MTTTITVKETTTKKASETSIITDRSKMTTIYVPTSSNSASFIPTPTSSASARSSTRGRLTTTITTFVPATPTETDSDIGTINIGETINNLPTTTKIIAGSAAGLLLICVVSYFAFRLRKYQKRKQEETELMTKGSAFFSPGRNNREFFSPPPTPKTPTSPTWWQFWKSKKD